MSEDRTTEGISFNNIHINSLVFNSGVFAGQNVQYNWSSGNSTQVGFGIIKGENNMLENPCSIVTDQSSSSELLDYFRQLAEKKMEGEPINGQD